VRDAGLVAGSPDIPFASAQRPGPARLGALLLALGLPAAPASQTPDPGPVLAAARSALGGDARLTAVRSVVVTGRMRLVRGKNLVPIEFEIACEFPDRYVRQNEIPAEETGVMKTGFNGDLLIQVPPPETARLDAPARAALVRANKQDFGRWSLGLFAASFPSYPLTFAYAGRAQAPAGAADAISATSPDGFASRLFIDTATHLPAMVTWQVGAVEHRLYFADYRDVDGLRWPFLMRRAVGGDTVEETTIDRYRVNAKVDARKFEVAR